MTRRISIPEELKPLPIGMLDAGTRALNGLAKLNVVTLGELDGVSDEWLLLGENMGPVAVDSILRAVEKVWSRRQELLDRYVSDPAGLTGEPAYDDPLWSLPPGVPRWLRDRPLPWSPGLRKLIETLAEYGITVVGHIWYLSDARLQLLDDVRRDAVIELRMMLYTIERSGPDRLAVISRSGWHPRLPGLRHVALGALLDAVTPAAEIRALVAGLRERDGGLWLRAACFRAWPRPTLTALAREHGISRARVRQIVRGHDADLRDSGVRLPLCSMLVQWVANRPGGTAETEEVLAFARRMGLDAREDELRALPRLATLGLVPGITYQGGIWTAAIGIVSGRTRSARIR